jgi:hypothetical protein
MVVGGAVYSFSVSTVCALIWAGTQVQRRGKRTRRGKDKGCSEKRVEGLVEERKRGLKQLCIWGLIGVRAKVRCYFGMTG